MQDLQIMSKNTVALIILDGFATVKPHNQMPLRQPITQFGSLMQTLPTQLN